MGVTLFVSDDIQLYCPLSSPNGSRMENPIIHIQFSIYVLNYRSNKPINNNGDKLN